MSERTELAKRLREKAAKEQDYLNRLISAQYWIPSRDGMEQSIADLLAAAEAIEAGEKASQILHAYGKDNEGTSHPWWAVVRKNAMGSNAILAGPFFSRQAAENHRKAREYDYGAKSIVFCFSGHWSRQYRELREALPAPPEVTR